MSVSIDTELRYTIRIGGRELSQILRALGGKTKPGEEQDNLALANKLVAMRAGGVKSILEANEKLIENLRKVGIVPIEGDEESQGNK